MPLTKALSERRREAFLPPVERLFTAAERRILAHLPGARQR